MWKKPTQKEIEWMNHYGDRYGAKKEKEKQETLIIGSRNANFISKKGTPKLIELQDAIKGNAVQGLSENNTNYSLTPQQDQLAEKIRKVWRRRPKIKTTWIRDRAQGWKTRTTVQQGGTAMIASGAAAEYMHESGEDNEGLARWTWMKFEGQSEIKTAIIQVYQPVYNLSGPGSVYQQQQSRIKDGKEVLRKYDDHLLKLVDNMMMEGFRIIIMGDFNMDVRNRRKRLIQELGRRGIKEKITSRYGEEKATNTYWWGKDPIDGLFASDELEMVRGGHQGGNPAMSDHKFIWGEFTYDSILGKERGKAYTPEMRRLQLKYKKVTKKFIQLLVKYMNEHNMLKQAKEIWETIKGDELDNEQWNLYEALDKEFEKAVSYADNKCRQLFPHNIEFSPEVKQAIGNLTIWKEIEKKIKRKQKIKGRYIRNMKKKYKVETHFNLLISAKECQRKVKTAWEEFDKIQKNAPELRDSFLDSLIREAEKLKTEEGIKKVKELRGIKETERSGESHAHIKAASGKLKSQGVCFVLNLLLK